MCTSSSLLEDGVLARRPGAFQRSAPASALLLACPLMKVMSVALCVALAGAGEENCCWVRMKTIVRSLHSWVSSLGVGYSSRSERLNPPSVVLELVELQ